ncbi:MAG: PAS domain-containing protein, partial [Emcibacteraceae bacterium]|nr:PAS domain-containing protein [Emcibacteraceae bacterium]
MFSKLKNITGGNDTDLEAELDALNKSQAVIEFQINGIIKDANDNFLKTLGYTLNEIKGKHHSMFVESDYGKSAEYKEFWEKLGRGEFQAAEYMRICKDGSEVWIQASYNPILDKDGKVTAVIKFATDITEQKMNSANNLGQIDAINKAQAVIHFNLDGTIIEANDNFLATLGYRLTEIQGKHHSMFVDTDYARSSEYKEFWAKLKSGEFQAA